MIGRWQMFWGNRLIGGGEIWMDQFWGYGIGLEKIFDDRVNESTSGMNAGSIGEDE
jgi:hypothetical protein